MIIGVVLVLTSAAGLIALNLTPLYTAASTIVVEPRNTRIIDFDDGNQDVPRDTSMINTHVKYLTSSSFVHQVIEQLDLLRDAEFNVALREKRPPDRFQALVSEAVSWAKMPLIAVGLANQPSSAPRWSSGADRDNGKEADLGAAGRDRTGPDMASPEATGPPVRLEVVDGSLEFVSDRGPRSAVEERDDVTLPHDGGREALMAAATKIFLDQLEVGASGQSYAISIAFTSIDPQTAARVAKAMAELYVEHQLESKRAATMDALAWLDGRLNELREQLIGTEQAAEAYRAEHELLVQGGGLELRQQELGALNQELIKARAERVATEAKLRQIRQLRSSGGNLQSVHEVMMSPVIANLRREEVQLLREEAQLRQEYGPRHPNLVQLQANKEKLAARIDAEIQSIIEGFANQIATIEVREKVLEAKLNAAKGVSAENNRAMIQLRLLEREAESTRSLYATFLNRFKELAEQREMLEPGVRVISAAAVPTAPSAPHVELVTGAGFMGSLMFASLLAFVVDRLDRGMRTGRQAEEVLDLPHVGFVPSLGGVARSRGPHRYLADKPTSAYAEAIRAVQTALYFSNIDRPPQVVLVTSSVPAEGKTTLALSLAALLARSGCKTVAVDLDLRRPSLGRALRRTQSGDLVDFMKGKATLEEILHEVDGVDNLHLIPAKRLAASPTDLLASQRMASFMAELRARYQYVVLDSPPLLGISDTRFASLLADAVVFVVRWSRTSEETALKGLKILRDGGAPVAGAVLTRVNVRRHRKYSRQDVIHHYGTYKQYYVN